MKIIFLVLSIFVMAQANTDTQNCTPIYDSDDGSIINSDCAKPQVEVKEKRAPAAVDDFDSETEVKDSGYESPLEE